MNMAEFPHITRLGLPGLDVVPFGMHGCHFYRSSEQLISVLAPYFLEGLRRNERCLGITAPSLPAKDAIRALRDSSSGVDDAIESGALRILDYDRWYMTTAELKGPQLTQAWLDEETDALAAGHSGLRITGNTGFLTPDMWPTFMDYERSLSGRFNGRRIVALCSYAQAACSERQTSEVMHAHHCTLEGPDTDGQMFAVPQLPRGTWSRL